MSVETAVAARDVVFEYGERKALAGVSFDAAEGEIFGFLGPNGGGKTTLFRILATLRRPHGGSIEVFGSDVVVAPRAVRRALGVVFQSPSLDPHLTVEENLRHQGRLYGLSGASLAGRIAEELDRFGLGDRGSERAGALSGGQQRRVEIAKALLHEPRLLLLDEPSTGLDPRARRDLRGTLESLRDDRGVTVLVTTHFMEEADGCDRLLLLDEGRVVASGTPDALKDEIGGDVVVLSTRDPEALAVEVGERFGLDATVVEHQVRFEHDAAHAFVSRVAEAFPGRIDSVTVARPTLEDVFLRRTGRGLGDDE